jgi:methylenetetrahydrofolate--tRNA-(uracil-5-)-methyltransferase
MTGVEGYVESAATGLIAARSLIAEQNRGETTAPPPSTAMGGLMRHLTARTAEAFQPANISWGLIVCPPDLRAIRKKRERREAQAARAMEDIAAWAASLS